MKKNVSTKEANKDASAKINAKAADAILAESEHVTAIKDWLSKNYVLTHVVKTDIRYLWDNRYRINIWKHKIGEDYIYVDKSFFVHVSGINVVVK